MILGTIYNPSSESLDYEFKEFCNKTLIEEILTKEELIKFIEDGKWSDKINYIINENIKLYFNTIIPKYYSCFGNSKIDGTIIIGVDDSGEITGIPYLKNLQKEYLQKLAYDTVSQFIVSDYEYNFLLSNINIEVIALDVDVSKLDDEIQKLFDEYNVNLSKYNVNLENFVKKKAHWEVNILRKYTTKLTTIINNDVTRKELIEFIEINCNNENKSILLNTLRSEKKIGIPIGEDVFEVKDDESNIIHWLTKFKDVMTQKALTFKPRKPINANKYSLHNFVNKLSNLRKKILLNNKDINYFLIEIKINGSNINKDIWYNYPGSKCPIYRQRTITDGFPYCF